MYDRQKLSIPLKLKSSNQSSQPCVLPLSHVYLKKILLSSFVTSYWYCWLMIHILSLKNNCIVAFPLQFSDLYNQDQCNHQKSMVTLLKGHLNVTILKFWAFLIIMINFAIQMLIFNLLMCQNCSFEHHYSIISQRNTKISKHLQRNTLMVHLIYFAFILVCTLNV